MHKLFLIFIPIFSFSNGTISSSLIKKTYNQEANAELLELLKLRFHWNSLHEKISSQALSLVKRGANPNLMPSETYTLLEVAARFDSFENLLVLLEHEADPNLHNRYTILGTAVVYDQLPNAQILLQYGADQNMKDEYGKTALDYARDKKKQAFIGLLTSQKIK